MSNTGSSVSEVYNDRGVIGAIQSLPESASDFDGDDVAAVESMAVDLRSPIDDLSSYEQSLARIRLQEVCDVFRGSFWSGFSHRVLGLPMRCNWNPSLHPRDPQTGKFVERPWDVPESIENPGSLSEDELLANLPFDPPLPQQSDLAGDSDMLLESQQSIDFGGIAEIPVTDMSKTQQQGLSEHLSEVLMPAFRDDSVAEEMVDSLTEVTDKTPGSSMLPAELGRPNYKLKFKSGTELDTVSHEVGHSLLQGTNYSMSETAYDVGNKVSERYDGSIPNWEFDDTLRPIGNHAALGHYLLRPFGMTDPENPVPSESARQSVDTGIQTLNIYQRNPDAYNFTPKQMSDVFHPTDGSLSKGDGLLLSDGGSGTVATAMADRPTYMTTDQLPAYPIYYHETNEMGWLPVQSDGSAVGDMQVSVDSSRSIESRFKYLDGQVSDDAQKRVERLVQELNTAFTKQAMARSRSLDESSVSPPTDYTIGRNYSATSGHESMSQLHEWMQTISDSKASSIRLMLRDNPELLDAYLAVFKPSPAVLRQVGPTLRAMGYPVDMRRVRG